MIKSILPRAARFFAGGGTKSNKPGPGAFNLVHRKADSMQKVPKQVKEFLDKQFEDPFTNKQLDGSIQA